MTFEDFLNELAQTVHLTTLKPDAQGACLLIWKEGQIPLLFEFDDQLVPNTILLSTDIAPIPVGYGADVYDALLKENSRLENTLSVKPDEEILYLHRRFHPESKAPEIAAILHQFLETVREWQKKLKTMTQSPPQKQKEAHPSAIRVFPYKA